MLTVGSLFSGIGGFDLGLERAGMRVLWQCEIDPYCQRVLAEHWPDVLRVPDIRDLRASAVERVDILCGGFPCQDLSVAGAGRGFAGQRSGLWAEYARVVGELRPQYVLVENVAVLLSRGFGRVLGDLAALGYDAEWDCLPASAFGAPHRRDRVWLVAHADQERRREGLLRRSRSFQPAGSGDAERGGEHLADAEGQRCRRARPATAVSDGGPLGSEGRSGGTGWEWAVEPDVGRVAYGVPARVDRLRGLGNALVPQIAEWIGRRIIDHERAVAA